MSETYEAKLSRIKSEDLAEFKSLKPEDFVLFSNVSCPEHYTFVCMLPPQVVERISHISRALKGLDESMIFNPLNKLHLTIFHCPAEIDIEHIKSIFEKYSEPMIFSLGGIRASSLGMGISAIPDNGAMINLRRKLYKEIGKELEDNARGLFSWVTLARCTKQPTNELLQFLLDHLHDDFGTFSPSSIELFRSNDKNLINAEKITEFKLEV